MTTKPKAKKFRIRRSLTTPVAASDTTRQQPESAAQEPVAPQRVAGPTPVAENAVHDHRQHANQPAGQHAGQPPRPAPDPDAAPSAQPAPDPALAGDVASARQVRGETDIEAIRREGLTGRQLRMARRVAQQHKLAATSDFDAVRLLRERGIDPFQRSNMLELVVPQQQTDQQAGIQQAGDQAPDHARMQLPPPPEVGPLEQRRREISDVQRELMQRRRRKMILLVARLGFFVMLPTIIAGWYYYSVATPMYSTKSEFLILQADNAGGTGIGGLLSGTQFATNQDSITVQSYLESKEVMLRLNNDAGFKDHFSKDWVDPIQRLPEGASNETAYKTYKKYVKLGYDPTEGVIKMEVSSPDPAVSAEFSKLLIGYAEDRVNELSQQKRGDQMDEAMRAFQQADTERRKAQQELVELQQKGDVLDPDGVIASLRAQINNVEVQLQERELQLAALLDNPRPNKAKVQGAQGDVRRLKALLQRLNDKMTDASRGENSLASLSVRIRMAEADLATRDLMLQSALQQVEQTRMEANRQVRYLTTAVAPVASESPSYPRKFENTILAFLIFSGVYLMLSLTASILREQVTS